MLVSVIIPTYKRSERLLTAIDSVLKQTYSKIEIIVVDDNNDADDYRIATEDKLQQHIKNNSITYIKHTSNLGGCQARNTGAKHANGFYLAFLDDDDFYENNKIETQVNYLKSNPNLDACICSMFRIDDTGQQIQSRQNIARGNTLKGAIIDGNLFTSMLLIKKSVFDVLEGFSEIPRFQDKFFHYKFLKQNYKIGIIEEQLLTLVDHDDVRISLASKEKIVKALDILHNFEKENKGIFNASEWYKIQSNYHTIKAYTLSQGNSKDKKEALKCIKKAFMHSNDKLNLLKLGIKIFTTKR
jgi:glycosyltransferase involved in cell wall biosynthesis